MLRRERISRQAALYIALYSLAGAIFVHAGTVNISGTTLFDNNSATAVDGGETVRARLWEVCEKRERACVWQFSMMVKVSSESVHHA